MSYLLGLDWETVVTPGNVPLVAVFVMITIICVAGIIGGTVRQIKNHQRDVLLKRDLAAHGYSVDEIERIVRAKPAKP